MFRSLSNMYISCHVLKSRSSTIYKSKMMPTTFDHNDNLLDNEKAAIVCLFCR